MRPLRFTTFLAPNIRPVYEFIARYVGEQLGCETELVIGGSYEEIANADIAFICGLPYVQWMDQRAPVVAPLVAPVLSGERYAGRPIYFSEVIVHRNSPLNCFADLRGAAWAYNEPQSHSGYGVVRHHLACMGETMSFFGRVFEAGFHERSIRMVAAGEADASAIDSQVLGVAQRDHPDLARQLRVIATLGPSTIQPVVAAYHLPVRLKEAVRTILLEMHRNQAVRAALAHGFVDRFVAVSDADYNDIRAMHRTSSTSRLAYA
jgi:phosphonate transport system substrate-binding protein